MEELTPFNPRKEPRQRRSRETVEVILEAAAQVFEDKGYAGTTTNHIARRAGVSVGSIYQYFPNKNAIVLKLLEKHQREGEAYLDLLLDDLRKNKRIDRDFWHRHIEAMVALHEKNPRLHKVLFEETPIISPLVPGAAENVYGPYSRKLMEALKECGPISRPDLAACVRLTLQTTEALTHWYVMHGSGVMKREQFIEELAEMLIGYIYV